MTDNTTDADGNVESTDDSTTVPDVEVDLSSDEADTPAKNGNGNGNGEVDAELVMNADADESEVEGDTDEFEEEFGVTEERLRERAEETAKQALESAEDDADNPSDLVEGAVETLQTKHTEGIQQLRQSSQTLKQARQQRDGLLETVEYLRDVAEDEDRLIIKTMPGGVAGELRSGERTDIADDYEEQAGELTGQIEQAEQRIQAQKQNIKKIEMAYQELQNPKGLLSEVVAGSLLDF